MFDVLYEGVERLHVQDDDSLLHESHLHFLM